MLNVTQDELRPGDLFTFNHSPFIRFLLWRTGDDFGYLINNKLYIMTTIHARVAGLQWIKLSYTK